MYARKVQNQTLTFRVSGKLWMRSLVMSDVETGSEWAHLLGRAMAGPLRGKMLEPIVSDMVTWSAWRDEFPDTTVLDLSNTSQDYTRDFYREPDRFVLGFRIAGRPYAIGLNHLKRNPVHGFRVEGKPLLATFESAGAGCYLFDRVVDDQVLEFKPADNQHMTDVQTGSRWERATGRAIAGEMNGKALRQLVGIMSYRRAWTAFHPDFTEVVP